MAGRTPNFNLTTLTGGENFALDGHKFTDADRVMLDRLIHAALIHDHSGTPPGDPGETVDLAPILTMHPDAGSLPAGVRLYYKIALVGTDGLPTLASPEASIDTPLPITSPAAPTASRSSTDGTLLPGTYYYRLSAYRGAATLETAASDAVAVALPTGSTTQRVLLTLPSAPVGADGYNIYRRAPGGSSFNHIATVALAAIADPWIDTGNLTVNCERFAPTRNTTSSSNSVEISYPGGVVPVGYTWRIYRTDTAGEWSHSHLRDVIEETSEGSGIVTPTYTDLGLGTTAGTPPAVTPPTIPTSPRIDYADLVGTQPVPTTETTVEFHVPDANITGAQTYQWMSPYDEAIIRTVYANLGVDATPVGTDLQVTVERSDPIDDWVPVTDGPVTIAIADNTAGPVTLVADQPTLVTGDRLRLRFDQAGGATATDLVVTVLLWTRTSEPPPQWPEPTP